MFLSVPYVPFYGPLLLELCEMRFLLACTLILFATPRWAMQTSGVTVRLRGVSAVNERVAWASGAGTTVLRTVDGGTTWQKLNVTNEALDFRDIDAVDEQ